MSELVLFGVSNMLGVLLDCSMALGHRVTRIVRNQPETVRPRTRSVEDRIKKISPAPDLIAFDDFAPRTGEIYALGTMNMERGRLVEDLRRRFDITLTSLVHPRAYVSPLATIGTGVFVTATGYIAADAELGPCALVLGGNVGHDVRVGAYSRISAGAVVAGHVSIGQRSIIGIGANVIEEIRIGDDVIVGAGAVVVRDVPDGITVVGIPARPTASKGS